MYGAIEQEQAKGLAEFCRRKPYAISELHSGVCYESPCWGESVKVTPANSSVQYSNGRRGRQTGPEVGRVYLFKSAASRADMILRYSIFYIDK